MHRRHTLPFDPKAGAESDLLEGKIIPGAAQGPSRARMAATILRILVGTRSVRERGKAVPVETDESEAPVEWAMRMMS